MNTSEEADRDIYTEDYDLWIKLTFVCIGTVSATTTIIALIILQRTKKIPQAAKILSNWLLIFDGLYILVVCVRKFILEPAINLNLQVLSQVLVQCSYLTICLMALERLVVFNWPYVYMKKFTVSRLRKIMFSVWGTNILIFYTLRYVVCYFKYRSTIYLVQAGLCHEIVYPHYAILLTSIIGISCACYFKIFSILLKMTLNTKQSLADVAKDLKGYKQTSIVLVYLLVIVVTTLGFIFVLVFRIIGILEVTELRWAIQIVALINCIFDPLLYVMWFRESRMELLKLLCFRSKAVQKKVETMRMEIFCIVTSQEKSKEAQAADFISPWDCYSET